MNMENQGARPIAYWVEHFNYETVIAKTVEHKLEVLDSYFLNKDCKIPPGSTKWLSYICWKNLLYWLDFTNEDCLKARLTNSIGIFLRREQCIAPDILHKKIIDIITESQNKIKIASDRWDQSKQALIRQRINCFVAFVAKPESMKEVEQKEAGDDEKKGNMANCLLQVVHEPVLEPPTDSSANVVKQGVLVVEQKKDEGHEKNSKKGEEVNTANCLPQVVNDCVLGSIIGPDRTLAGIRARCMANSVRSPNQSDSVGEREKPVDKKCSVDDHQKGKNEEKEPAETPMVENIENDNGNAKENEPVKDEKDIEKDEKNVNEGEKVAVFICSPQVVNEFVLETPSVSSAMVVKEGVGQKSTESAVKHKTPSPTPLRKSMRIVKPTSRLVIKPDQKSYD